MKILWISESILEAKRSFDSVKIVVHVHKNCQGMEKQKYVQESPYILCIDEEQPQLLRFMDNEPRVS